MAGLYKDGVLEKPKNYAYPFPNLLTFHDARTVIEQKLFVMYLEHCMRSLQGMFYGSNDYALWYGWSEMQRDFTEIKEPAENLRRNRASGPRASTSQGHFRWNARMAVNLVRREGGDKYVYEPDTMKTLMACASVRPHRRV